MTAAHLAAAHDDDFCYLTTRGRVTGADHEIEIWFALDGTTLFLLAGAGDVRLGAQPPGRPAVTVRVRDVTYDATARVVSIPKRTPAPAPSCSRSTSPATVASS